MKNFGKFLSLGALFIASAVAAHATPITGYITFGGSDTFTSTQITFNNDAFVNTSAGTLATPRFSSATLTSFIYANAVGTTLFSVPTPNGISFVINSMTSSVYDPTVPSEVLKGTGTFSETGYDNTSGTFTLSTSTSGATTLQLNSNVSAVTPEPSSLVLLGSGVMSAAGMVMRRRRAV